MNAWPHQDFALDEIAKAIAQDRRRICLQCPTGGGKTWIMQELARRWLEDRKKVVLYTNRRGLADQTSEKFEEAGMYHGRRAAGHEDQREHRFQIAMIQTEQARVLKQKKWELHKADLVIFDEGHLHTGPGAVEIRKRHRDDNAVIVDFTATPLGMADVCDFLICAGTNSELRQCGALVPAIHYGPDEPDLRAFKKLQDKLNSGENLSEKDAAKAMMTPDIMGRVWTWFEQLNPDRRPTILFAPGVKESVWFAEQFEAKGVKAAHIDGTDVWVDGEFHRTSKTVRDQILGDSKSGRIKVICNRFVLREGIDCPWLAHGIFATIFGSIQSYLQSGGRLLRSAPSLESVTIQDHGGNWHRHGSLNEDRQWDLNFTQSIVVGMRQDKMRSKQRSEPFRCPRCGRVWTMGYSCQPSHGGCGYEIRPGKQSRPVVSTDGRLVELSGDIYRPRRVSTSPSGVKIWEKMYYRAKSPKWNGTFRQAEATYARENNWFWPDRNWPLMPIQPLDFYLKVADVPRERLR